MVRPEAPTHLSKTRCPAATTGRWPARTRPTAARWSPTTCTSASSVPHIWYRASMAWGPTPLSRVTGVTLPGVPSLIVGSNGAIAWGFTNTTADWTDLVALEIDADDPTRYRTPDGWRAFTTRARRDRRGSRPRARPSRCARRSGAPSASPTRAGASAPIAWVPLREGGLNLARAGHGDGAMTIEEACAAAAQAGHSRTEPRGRASRDGRIGWSVAGRIPRRIGFDGRLRCPGPTARAAGRGG